MNLNTSSFFNSNEVHVSSRMNEYMKKNFGYEVEGDIDTLQEAKKSLEVEQQELKNHHYMSKKYIENMLMIETITALLKAHGKPLKEDDESKSSETVNEDLEEMTYVTLTNLANKLKDMHDTLQWTRDESSRDNRGSTIDDILDEIKEVMSVLTQLNKHYNKSVDEQLSKKKKITEDDDEELINKVAEWIYHESSEPISEIEYLLKKSDAVGEYMDAVSESKESVKEDDEMYDIEKDYEVINMPPHIGKGEIMTKGGVKVTFAKAIRKIVHLFGTNYLTLAMKKFGINSLDDLKTDADKQKFFDYVYSINPKEWGQYRESVKEDDEMYKRTADAEKGPEHYRWKNDSQLAVVIGRIEGAIDELDNAIQYRGENSANFFNNGDKAGVGGLMGIKQKLEDIHSEWDKNTEYYGM